MNMNKEVLFSTKDTELMRYLYRTIGAVETDGIVTVNDVTSDNVEEMRRSIQLMGSICSGSDELKDFNCTTTDLDIWLKNANKEMGQLISTINQLSDQIKTVSAFNIASVEVAKYLKENGMLEPDDDDTW